MTRDSALARDAAGGAWVALPFVALVVALERAAPPGPASLAAADPFVLTLRAWGGAFAVPALAAAVIGFRLARVPPRDALDPATLVRAVAGAAVAAGVLLVLRAAFGPALPSFVPPEESARPGLLLGLSAGVGEEVLFRLALLTSLAASMSGRRGGRALAVVATGALFAAAHELPPAARAFRPDLLVTRFLVPGCAFGALYLVLGPAFLVAAHCTAHLLIPLLFAGG